MKLLITGGAGYIGSHVTLSALEKGYEVTVFDDLSSGSRENLFPNVRFVLGSLCSQIDLQNLFKSRKYDAVIHLAGSKAARDSMENPRLYLENNICAGLNLINASIMNNVSLFILSSSAAVYGFPDYIPIDENHPLRPSNYYGYTKLVLEQNLKWFSKMKNLSYASLRYFNAAGYDQMKRVRTIETNPKNLIPIAMEVAIGIKKYLHIFGNNYNTKDGTGVRDYIHVSDLSSAHLDALDYISSNKKNLELNLGVGKGYSVLDIIKRIEFISMKKIKFKIVDKRIGDSGTIISSSDMAKSLIGWSPKFSNIDNIIKTTWSVYNTNFKLS